MRVASLFPTMTPLVDAVDCFRVTVYAIELVDAKINI